MNTIIAPHGTVVAHGDDRLPVRFWEKTQLSESGCWEWTAQVGHHGYARYSQDSKSRKAHRVSYEALVAPIPDGLVIDHLCRVRHCVNPAHLEAVTNAENIRRGESKPPASQNNRSALKSHCTNGHAFSGDNLRISPRGTRVCRTCQRTYSRESAARKRVGLTDPTNLPAGDRRPQLVTLSTPPAPAADLFVSEDGKRWRLAGTDETGGRLFVPEQVNPATTPRWVWAREAELAEVVGTLAPIAQAAA